MTGADLEFLEYLLDGKEDADGLVYYREIFKRFCISISPEDYPKVPSSLLRSCVKVFCEEVISKHFMKKMDWLRLVFYLADKSFSRVEHFEHVPMEKICAMQIIVKEHYDRVNSERTPN